MTNADRIALHERMVRLEERERVCALLEREAAKSAKRADGWAECMGEEFKLVGEDRRIAELLRHIAESIKHEEHWTTKEGT